MPTNTLLTLLLIVSAFIIPTMIYLALKTYEAEDRFRKTTVGIAIALLLVGILRFFYTASLYQNGFLPAKELPFSYLSILIIVALIATFNKTKLGELFKRVLVLSFLIPVVFPLFADRIYLNPDDQHFVTTALYFIEVGFITTLAMLFILEKNKRLKIKDALISALSFIVYMGIAIGLNFGWKLEIPFDLYFYLSYGLSLLSIFIIYGVYVLINHLYKKKHTIKENDDLVI